MIKGILIDMGDTLIHNVNFNFSKALDALYDAFDNPIVSRQEFHKFENLVKEETFDKRQTIEIRCMDYIRLLMRRFDLHSKYTLEELEDIFVSNISQTVLVDNVIDVLEHFKKKNYKIIVLSNTMFSSSVISKELSQISSYFTEIIASGDYVVRKPDKAFFELGIGRMGLATNEIVYIGNDYYFDIYGSSLVGMKSVWLNEKELIPPKEFEVKDYIEIKNYKQLIDMDF